MRIVAYTYEAGVHCPTCAKKRSLAAPEHGGFNVNDFHPHAVKPYRQNDEHGIPVNSIDREGNLIHPVFDTDESPATDCGDCGRKLCDRL